VDAHIVSLNDETPACVLGVAGGLPPLVPVVIVLHSVGYESRRHIPIQSAGKHPSNGGSGTSPGLDGVAVTVVERLTGESGTVDHEKRAHVGVFAYQSDVPVSER